MYSNWWNDIILLNLNSFENIGVDFYINLFFLMLAVCICIIAVFFEIYRGCQSLIFKQLLRHGCIGEDNAKPLVEIGLYNNKILKFYLGHNSYLSRYVLCAGEQKLNYEEYLKLDPIQRRAYGKKDVNTAAFYISHDNVDYAKKIHNRYEFSAFRMIVFCLFILISCALVITFSYEIVCLLNSWLGTI